MDVEFIGTKGTWREVADSCNTTIGRGSGTKEPTSNWRNRILRSEHSPIRTIQFKWRWINLPYWASTHFCRHWLGFTNFVKSQRTDRNNGDSRDKKPQDAPVIHEVEANIQALINVSRKRLCNCASKETRESWQTFLNSIKDKHPEVYNACRRECVYRNGMCPEFYSCRYNHTPEFLRELKDYQKGFEQQINIHTLITQGGLNGATIRRMILFNENYENKE